MNRQNNWNWFQLITIEDIAGHRICICEKINRIKIPFDKNYYIHLKITENYPAKREEEKVWRFWIINKDCKNDEYREEFNIYSIFTKNPRGVNDA